MRVDVPRLLEVLGIEVARREGPELWAPCPHPNHPDRDPSWSILNDPASDRHGYHRCFGCELGGGPVSLASSVLSLSTREAARWLEEQGLEVGEGPVPSEVELAVVRPRARRRFRPPDGVVSDPLEQWPERPRGYLHSRGFGAREVERWGLGYALHGRLAGRIVFPVRDRARRLASYMARSFDGRAPRYMTPNRELEGPDDAVLFGEEHWPEHSGDEEVVLAEGAINALACEQAGARYVAAIGGSELSPDQAAKLSRWGRILRVSDPDPAGDKLAIATSFLDRWSTLREAFLPAGTDARDLDVADLRRMLHAARD